MISDKNEQQAKQPALHFLSLLFIILTILTTFTLWLALARTEGGYAIAQNRQHGY